MNSSDPLTREELENIRIALTMNRPMSEPMKPTYSPHGRVTEHDGAFWCLDCKAKWGALPGEPLMPEACVKPAQEGLGSVFETWLDDPERERKWHTNQFTERDGLWSAYYKGIETQAKRIEELERELSVWIQRADKTWHEAHIYERCAKVCEEYAAMRWDVYRRSDGQDRANPYVEGQSDAADHCATAIRALDEPKS